jgi:hypothetical protein
MINGRWPDETSVPVAEGTVAVLSVFMVASQATPPSASRNLDPVKKGSWRSPIEELHGAIINDRNSFLNY